MSLQKYRAALIQRVEHNTPDPYPVSDVYLAPHVEAELARLREESQRSLSLANQCADERDKAIDALIGCRHDNDLLRRAVEWCLENGARFSAYTGQIEWLGKAEEVPAEFAEIISGANTP